MVELACKSANNVFGYGIWTHHIKPMIPLVQELAQQFGANEEIVTIATLLHDLAAIKNYQNQKDHHIVGAAEAERILEQFNYPKAGIDVVKACILNHRSSVVNQKNSLEEICVSDADAIIHMREIGSLFYAAYKEMKMDIESGKAWIRNKIQKDWNKMSEKSKKLYTNRYKALMEFL